MVSEARVVLGRSDPKTTTDALVPPITWEWYVLHVDRVTPK